MQFIYEQWKKRGTRIIGLINGTVGIISVSTGVIPLRALPYFVLANALLTYWRGNTNSKVLENEQASN